MKKKEGLKMIKIAIIGLGARGADVYGTFINNNIKDAKIVQIADPNVERRNKFKKNFNISCEFVYSSGDELLNDKKIADAIIIATPDKLHYKDTIKALNLGYDILLEKPISPSEDECIEIKELAAKKGRIVALCHVLRYAPLYTKIKEILDSKVLGEIVHIHQIEHIGYWHFAHSYVRGNWRNEKESAPVLLAKSCHDIDNIIWFMDKEVERVSSMGSLFHFKKENKPKGHPERSLDCYDLVGCPYDANKIYLENFLKDPDKNKDSWPYTVLTPYPSVKTLKEAINNGPYGRSVYDCDNDVMDNQMVNMAFKDGSHAHLTLIAHTGSNHRQIKIMGTRGELEANDKDQTISIKIFDGSFDVKPTIIDLKKENLDLSGHGGGDSRLVLDFINLLKGNTKEVKALTTIDESIKSHLIIFKAEESRKENGALKYL